MSQNASPVVQRRRLRLELKQARQEVGLTQEMVAEQMDWSLSKIIRIETTALKFSGLWGLVSDFPGLVTVWLHVGRGGVTGCGGP